MRLKYTIKNLLKQQCGATVILYSFSLLGFLAITGLAVDGGTLYTTKSDLQKAANAAVLSGAQELTNDEESVSEVVKKVLEKHHEKDSLKNISIQPGKKVSVDLEKIVDLSFMSIFGDSEAEVDVHAAAETRSMGRAKGVAPVGIDSSIELEFYKEYRLKVDESESDTGNFGILALGGPGANTYYENLRYGYDNPVELGDVIETETGNVVGKTQKAVDELINACPYSIDEAEDRRDCERIILIPVYEPHEYHGSNQVASVKIVGFAYFYISEPVDKKEKTINGKFIKRVGGGTGRDNASDFGAYGIRLTE